VNAGMDDVERERYEGAEHQRRKVIEEAHAAAARSEPRHDEATLWRDVLDGKWRIVDVFDAIGGHYFVACEALPQEKLSLSMMERRILERVVLGQSNKQIAHELNKTPSTVATHLSRAMRKLGLASRSVLVLLHAALRCPSVASP
jgi:DNA-binding CsgD family transcriptional regulator